MGEVQDQPVPAADQTDAVRDTLTDTPPSWRLLVGRSGSEFDELARRVTADGRFTDGLPFTMSLD